MKRIFLCFFALVLLAPATAHAAPATVKSERCKKFYDSRYLKASSPKAFAVSADGIRCGAAWGADSKNIAKKNALGYCTPRAKKSGSGKCRIIDIK